MYNVENWIEGEWEDEVDIGMLLEFGSSEMIVVGIGFIMMKVFFIEVV